ncbi:hypothetical protein [Maricaulis sp.]|uniref:hypothetical protein n=1 Tax=Maricaulis sp. TaxID=1486257 RepID=UPI0026294999|nr:hypothetical protein [Maricaulis sp.]
MLRSIILAGLVAAGSASVAQAQTCDAEPTFAAQRGAGGLIRAQLGAVSRGEWAQAIHFGGEVAESGASPRLKAVALNNTCIAYAESGEFEAAIAACNESLERRGGNWHALNNRGAAYWLAGNRGAAIADFAAAEEAKSGEEEVAANMALASCAS